MQMGSEPLKCSIRREAPAARGFTLVEVLVALTIVAVSLMASLRATGALSASAFCPMAAISLRP
jgi:general secretion pathway protein I